MKPPMPYAGGKQAMAKTIVSIMPPHLHYVEPYAGALSVLLAKPPSHLETVNDLDEEIVTFWRVLRDQPAALERMCALTPHSRAEYMTSRVPGQDGTDLEKAWRVWVRLTQGRGSRTNGTSGWRFVQGGTTRHTLARYLDGYIGRIAPAAQRLFLVSLECRPALEVIQGYDRPETLFYIDPPYLGSTRWGSQYSCEVMSEDDHRKLLDTLTGCSGNVILSGYRSALYDQALTDWERIECPVACMTGAKRVECLWTNFSPRPSLFDDEEKREEV